MRIHASVSRQVKFSVAEAPKGAIFVDQDHVEGYQVGADPIGGENHAIRHNIKLRPG